MKSININTESFHNIDDNEILNDTLERKTEFVYDFDFNNDLTPKKIISYSNRTNFENIAPDSLNTEVYENEEELIPKSEPVLILNKRSEKNDNFVLLQEWEGYVSEINESTFKANIFDLTSNELIEEVAEFNIDDILADDRELIQIGAIFYWTIGYLDIASGRFRSSLIKFRRLPAFSDKDLIKIEESAKEIFDYMNSENVNENTK